MPEDLHPNTDSAAAPDEEVPVEQLIWKVKPAGAPCSSISSPLWMKGVQPSSQPLA